ncbi:unnamed protein product, partial [Rotaria sp. Silwood2]
QQIRAQNECLASMQQVISTTIDCSVNLSTTNNILCEFVKTVCRDEQKEHIESMKNTNGVTTTHLMQLKDSFQREMIQYSTIMHKQIKLYQLTMESIFSSQNG